MQFIRTSVPVLFALFVVVAISITIIHSRPESPSGLQSAGISSPASQATPVATPIAHYGPETGAVGDALISPDNVTLQVIDIQKTATKWMVHIHAHNNNNNTSATASTTFLAPTADHYFMISGKGTPGVAYTNSQMFLKLTTAGQADLGTHPALPASVSPDGDGDGWLVADLSTFKLQPYQLLYVYGTVTAPACSGPTTNSTCTTAVGYRTLVWTL